MKTKLQAMRKKAGFTSAVDFANHIGVNTSTYTRHEQGGSFTLDQAYDYADALGCTIDDIAGYPSEDDELTADERRVIEAMRATDERGREVIVSVAETQPKAEQ